MTDRQWEKAWPTEFRKDLKAEGLTDSQIDGLTQATTMEKALQFLSKATLERNKALSEVLKKRFGRG